MPDLKPLSKYKHVDVDEIIDHLKDLHDNIRYRFCEIPKTLDDNWSFEIIESKDYPDYIKNPTIINYNPNKLNIRESSKTVVLKREDVQNFIFFDFDDLKAVSLLCRNNKIEKIGELEFKTLLTPLGYCSHLRSADLAFDMETDLEYLVLS